jgi:hypothetical protein
MQVSSRTLLGIVLALPATALSHQRSDAPQCRPVGALVKVPEISEASGIAASRRDPGLLWALNDSGQPVIYALDAKATLAGQVRLTGAMVEDWEAIAVGPCGTGSCVYVGDIGDNGATRKNITIYRLSEPNRTESAATTERIDATYPDGPHDAESLLIAPDGTLYVVTKGDNESVGLYRFPRDLRPGASVRLERVGTPRDSHDTKQDDRITDGAMSPQGDWVVLRTNRALLFHRAKDLLSGNWRPAHLVDLAELGEPQGEGVTFGPDNSLVLVGEGGGKSAAGTLARLSCPPLR